MKGFPARKMGVLRAGILIRLVLSWGRTPLRAPLLLTRKVPKPVKVTFFPCWSCWLTVAVKVCKTSVTNAWLSLVFWATAAINSLRFIG